MGFWKDVSIKTKPEVAMVLVGVAEALPAHNTKEDRTWMSYLIDHKVDILQPRAVAQSRINKLGEQVRDIGNGMCVIRGTRLMKMYHYLHDCIAEHVCFVRRGSSIEVQNQAICRINCDIVKGPSAEAAFFMSLWKKNQVARWFTAVTRLRNYHPGQTDFYHKRFMDGWLRMEGIAVDIEAFTDDTLTAFTDTPTSIVFPSPDRVRPVCPDAGIIYKLSPTEEDARVTYHNLRNIARSRSIRFMRHGNFFVITYSPEHDLFEAVMSVIDPTLLHHHGDICHAGHAYHRPIHACGCA